MGHFVRLLKHCLLDPQFRWHGHGGGSYALHGETEKSDVGLPPGENKSDVRLPPLPAPAIPPALSWASRPLQLIERLAALLLPPQLYEWQLSGPGFQLLYVPTWPNSDLPMIDSRVI
jgi:hypothetical protein